MGWSFCYSHHTKKQLTDSLVESYENNGAQYIINFCRDCNIPALDDSLPNQKIVVNTIKQKLVGNCFWRIIRQTLFANGIELYHHDMIMVDLIQYDRKRKCYGHKSMSEYCGPCYYNCPESFLKETTLFPGVIGDSRQWAENWREKVVKYHKINNIEVKIGDIVELIDGLTFGRKIVKMIIITYVKSKIVGVEPGSLARCRIKREHIKSINDIAIA